MAIDEIALPVGVLEIRAIERRLLSRHVGGVSPADERVLALGQCAAHDVYGASWMSVAVDGDVAVGQGREVVVLPVDAMYL